MFIRFEAAGTVEIHGVRRIEEDYLCWYVWYGKPSDGPASLRPQIFRKDAGTLTIVKED